MSVTAVHADSSLKGGLLILASTAFFALSGVFTKIVERDTWTILGWRGVIGGLLVLAYVAAMQKRAGLALDLRLGRKGWILAVTSALAGALFVASFKFTSVAVVVVVYATVPFFAAGIGLLWLAERAHPRTLLAAALCVAGVGVTVAGNMGAGTVGGALVSLAATIMCAVYLVMVRLFREAPAVWASGVAAFLLTLPAMLVGDYADLSMNEVVVMSLFGVSYAAAIVTWTEGARLLPSPEAGLIGSVEIPMAALFAALLLGEVPSWATLLGGLIVLGAVFGHSALEYRRQP
jgi:drug/metabolite transporter (DMT)-like permease